MDQQTPETDLISFEAPIPNNQVQVIKPHIHIPIAYLITHRRCMTIDQLVCPVVHDKVQARVPEMKRIAHGYGSKKDGIFMALHALSLSLKQDWIALSAIIEWLQQEANILNIERNASLYSSVKRLVALQLVETKTKDRQLYLKLNREHVFDAPLKPREMSDIMRQHSGPSFLLEKQSVYHVLASMLGWNWGWNSDRLDRALEILHEMDSEFISMASTYWGIPASAMECFILEHQLYLHEWLQHHSMPCPEPQLTPAMLIIGEASKKEAKLELPPSPLRKKLKLEQSPRSKEIDRLSWLFHKQTDAEYLNEQLDQLNQVVQQVTVVQELDCGLVRDLLWDTDSFHHNHALERIEEQLKAFEECTKAMSESEQGQQKKTSSVKTPTLEFWERAERLKEAMWPTENDGLAPVSGYTSFQESLEKPGFVCELVRDFIAVHHLKPIHCQTLDKQKDADTLVLPSFTTLFQ